MHRHQREHTGTDAGELGLVVELVRRRRVVTNRRAERGRESVVVLRRHDRAPVSSEAIRPAGERVPDLLRGEKRRTVQLPSASGTLSLASAIARRS
jgi:hypothetical protein